MVVYALFRWVVGVLAITLWSRTRREMFILIDPPPRKELTTVTISVDVVKSLIDLS